MPDIAHLLASLQQQTNPTPDVLGKMMGVGTAVQGRPQVPSWMKQPQQASPSPQAADIQQLLRDLFAQLTAPPAGPLT